MHMIFHELSILSKSIHFKNLSAAALHVGLSQPQLSRIIAKIEDELKISLLDRSAKRKSGWTPVAFELAEIYEKSIKRLESDLIGVTNTQLVSELHIGTLEGLSSLAIQAAKSCFDHIGIKKMSVDIYDLNELDAHFLSGDLDIIFTSKIPGKQKFKHLEEMGFQSLEKISSGKKYAVLSSFEYGRSKGKDSLDFQHILVSNSLALRREWLESVGGAGVLPSEIKRYKGREQEPVYMIGSEMLNPKIWETLKEKS